MERNVLVGDFVLLLFSTLIISVAVGSTTTQKTTEVVTTTQSISCEDPCVNCSSSGHCLQRCDDGYYYEPDLTTMSKTTVTTPTTTRTTTPTTIPTTTTTTVATPAGTTTTVPLVHLHDQGRATSSNGSGQHPSCKKCVDKIHHCDECFQNQSTVFCSKCSNGYTISISMMECSGSGSDEFPDWAIALTVVLSVLVLAGVGVAIFFGVRRYKVNKPRTPPPLPSPGNL